MCYLNFRLCLVMESDILLNLVHKFRVQFLLKRKEKKLKKNKDVLASFRCRTDTKKQKKDAFVKLK